MAQKEEVRFIRKNGRVIPIRAKKGSGKKEKPKKKKPPTRGEYVASNTAMGALSGALGFHTMHGLRLNAEISAYNKAATAVNMDLDALRMMDVESKSILKGKSFNPLVAEFREYAAAKLRAGKPINPKQKALPLSFDAPNYGKGTLEFTKTPEYVFDRKSMKGGLKDVFTFTDNASSSAYDFSSKVNAHKAKWQQKIDFEKALDKAMKEARPRLNELAYRNMQSGIMRDLAEVTSRAEKIKKYGAGIAHRRSFRYQSKWMAAAGVLGGALGAAGSYAAYPLIVGKDKKNGAKRKR